MKDQVHMLILRRNSGRQDRRGLVRAHSVFCFEPSCIMCVPYQYTHAFEYDKRAFLDLSMKCLPPSVLARPSSKALFVFVQTRCCCERWCSGASDWFINCRSFLMESRGLPVSASRCHGLPMQFLFTWSKKEDRMRN